MKVSVVIPIYNAVRFLGDMLQDVVNQTLEDIEIICVDDGSTDGSGDVVRSFMEKDARIHLLCQQNLYCGVARNNGMAAASGKYIIFWDADDRFEPDALQRMVDRAEETNADICVCGADDFDSETGTRIQRKVYLNTSVIGDKEPFNRYDAPEYIFNFTSNVVWNKLFRRSFVEQHALRFGEGDFSEETMFVQPALYYAERICYVDKKLIRYRTFNPDSAVTNTSYRKTKYYKDLYHYYTFMQQTGEFALLEVSIRNKLLGSCLVDLESNTNYEQFCETYHNLKEYVFYDFGLVDKEEAFFRTKENYRKMRFILEHEPEEYLLWNIHQAKRDFAIRIQKQQESSKQKLAAQKKEFGKLQKESEEKKKQIAALGMQLKALNAQNAELEMQLKALNTQNTQLEMQLKTQKAQNTDIINSVSYRVGRAITWLPRKLK